MERGHAGHPVSVKEKVYKYLRHSAKVQPGELGRTGARRTTYVACGYGEQDVQADRPGRALSPLSVKRTNLTTVAHRPGVLVHL